eukprot:jgi/Bigna1/83231/fgenesh1_pg.104_\
MRHNFVDVVELITKGNVAVISISQKLNKLEFVRAFRMQQPSPSPSRDRTNQPGGERGRPRKRKTTFEMSQLSARGRGGGRAGGRGWGRRSSGNLEPSKTRTVGTDTPSSADGENHRSKAILQDSSTFVVEKQDPPYSNRAGRADLGGDSWGRRPWVPVSITDEDVYSLPHRGMDDSIGARQYVRYPQYQERVVAEPSYDYEEFQPVVNMIKIMLMASRYFFSTLSAFMYIDIHAYRRVSYIPRHREGHSYLVERVREYPTSRLQAVQRDMSVPEEEEGDERMPLPSQLPRSRRSRWVGYQQTRPSDGSYASRRSRPMTFSQASSAAASQRRPHSRDAQQQQPQHLPPSSRYYRGSGPPSSSPRTHASSGMPVPPAASATIVGGSSTIAGTPTSSSVRGGVVMGLSLSNSSKLSRSSSTLSRSSSNNSRSQPLSIIAKATSSSRYVPPPREMPPEGPTSTAHITDPGKRREEIFKHCKWVCDCGTPVRFVYDGVKAGKMNLAEIRKHLLNSCNNFAREFADQLVRMRIKKGNALLNKTDSTQEPLIEAALKKITQDIQFKYYDWKRAHFEDYEWLTKESQARTSRYQANRAAAAAAAAASTGSGGKRKREAKTRKSTNKSATVRGSAAAAAAAAGVGGISPPVGGTPTLPAVKLEKRDDEDAEWKKDGGIVAAVAPGVKKEDGKGGGGGGGYSKTGPMVVGTHYTPFDLSPLRHGKHVIIATSNPEGGWCVEVNIEVDAIGMDAELVKNIQGEIGADKLIIKHIRTPAPIEQSEQGVSAEADADADADAASPEAKEEKKLLAWVEFRFKVFMVVAPFEPDKIDEWQTWLTDKLSNAFNDPNSGLGIVKNFRVGLIRPGSVRFKVMLIFHAQQGQREVRQLVQNHLRGFPKHPMYRYPDVYVVDSIPCVSRNYKTPQKTQAKAELRFHHRADAEKAFMKINQEGELKLQGGGSIAAAKLSPYMLYSNLKMKSGGGADMSYLTAAAAAKTGDTEQQEKHLQQQQKRRRIQEGGDGTSMSIDSAPTSSPDDNMAISRISSSSGGNNPNSSSTPPTTQTTTNAQNEEVEEEKAAATSAAAAAAATSTITTTTSSTSVTAVMEQEEDEDDDGKMLLPQQQQSSSEEGEEETAAKEQDHSPKKKRKNNTNVGATSVDNHIDSGNSTSVPDTTITTTTTSSASAAVTKEALAKSFQGRWKVVSNDGKQTSIIVKDLQCLISGTKWIIEVDPNFTKTIQLRKIETSISPASSAPSSSPLSPSSPLLPSPSSSSSPSVCCKTVLSGGCNGRLKTVKWTTLNPVNPYFMWIREEDEEEGEKTQEQQLGQSDQGTAQQENHAQTAERKRKIPSEMNKDIPSPPPLETATSTTVDTS